MDFEKTTSLFLAYPEGVIDCVIDYSPASKVFDELIKAIPRKTNLVVFVKSAEISKKVSKLHRNTTTLVNNELSSIWLRDSAGFNMGTHIVKPIFKPKYYRKYFEEAALIDQSMKIIHSILGIDMVKIPLIWDCGNLVTNGEIGFITDQVLADNKKSHDETQVKEIIQSHLKIEPILIQTHPDDIFGHSDAYLSFVNRNTIAISKYPEDADKKDLKYLEEVKTIVQKYISNVIEIKENPTFEEKNNIESAKGLYVNFQSLGNLIFMPSYGNSDEEKYNKDLLSRYGKVYPINCNELAAFGGLLHCISFTN
ncbi:MAG: agmatine deiminase family protein [Ignavibacteriaceae bacterium]|nr:agmatine deiminase family protein [Ignavibacteriaceae bacterium]